jgi:glyoxylase-like metal-dependent hydrolase (beta-lactamase superfamily II)
VQWLLETHAHADHMSAAAWLKSEIGGRIAIGARIADVQARFARLFDLGPDFRTDGSAFDRLFEDGDVFSIGSLGARVIATPGHTPACVTYVVGNAAFVGDTLFRPDYGTARADFPGGDARTLFRSARRILELPPDTRLFTGHDYPSPGRAAMCESSVAAQRRGSAWVGDGVSEDDYVARRRARDRTLALPSLILPALQVNIRAGRLPESSANGIRYLRIPIDQFGATR